MRLGEAGAPPAPARKRPATGASSRLPLLIIGVFMALVGSVTALGSYMSGLVTPPPAARPATHADAPVPGAAANAPAPAPAPVPPAAGKPAVVGYPMRSLLGVSVAVDIDGSRAHMGGLFPGISTGQLAGELRYSVPLSHRWFSVAELSWKNEKAGKLDSVAFRPPLGDDKFKNQKEIADCLSKGLGSPKVRELDHLAGELSYFWGPHFPTAWADLYASYLWLSFDDPKGVPPVTLAQVVRSLDGCAP
ncbi:MAG TPA: hypothetical protein VNG33_13990 [Polyangiaceae bacterium]|nr:hypothetical protein [Polyangiaceae bacterium]